MSHLLGLDVETTGLDQATTSLTEVAFVHYNGEERLSELNIRLSPKPEKLINLGALKVTKQNLTSLHINAYTPTEAAHIITNYLCSTVVPIVGNKELRIIGHNVSGDIARVKELLKENGIVGWEEIFSYRTTDTATIGEFMRTCGAIEIDKMSLETLAKSLGIDTTKYKFHTALGDVDVTFQVYFAMLKLMRVNYGKKING